MSDQPPSGLPSTYPAQPRPSYLPKPDEPLGADPAEREAIKPAGVIEAILREPRRVLFQLRQPGAPGLIATMLVVAAVCSLVYGVVVGTFSGGMQLWAAPVKVAAVLFLSTLICLPSLYIFACLSGAKVRLREICGLVAGMLALLTLLLIGFAPVAWLFGQSTESLAWMGTLHLAFGLIAAGFGLRFLLAGFTQADATYSAGLQVWIVIFMLVLLQMTTTLRPIVGTAPTWLPAEKEFFVSHWSDCLDGKNK
jgi:hypothetical protein